MHIYGVHVNVSIFVDKYHHENDTFRHFMPYNRLNENQVNITHLNVTWLQIFSQSIIGCIGLGIAHYLTTTFIRYFFLFLSIIIFCIAIDLVLLFLQFIVIYTDFYDIQF